MPSSRIVFLVSRFGVSLLPRVLVASNPVPRLCFSPPALAPPPGSVAKWVVVVEGRVSGKGSGWAQGWSR